jgi:F-type H+-transporting ATPase subunit gamma
MASAQMQQGERALEAVRHYSEIIRQAFVEAAALVPEDRETSAPRMRSRRGMVVFCAEHGFCGAFNQPLIRAATAAAKLDEDLYFLFIGSRGSLRAAEHGLTPQITLGMASHIGGVGAAAQRIGAALYRLLSTEVITSADMLYIRETETGAARLERSTLLPLDAPPATTHQANAPPLVNMQPRRLREELATEYMFAMLEAAAMESFTSENAARFRTMQAAHENIERKGKELNRLARRLRQEAVTAEILELIAGTDALDQKPRL